MTWSEQMRCIVLVDMALMRLVAGAALLGTTEAFALSGGRGGSGGGSCSGLLSAPSAGEEAEAVAVAVRELHGDEEATAPSLGRREEAAAAAAKELMSMGAVIYAEPKCGRRRREALFMFLLAAAPEVAVTYSTMYCLYGTLRRCAVRRRRYSGTRLYRLHSKCSKYSSKCPGSFR